MPPSPSPPHGEPIPLPYRGAMQLCRPIVEAWGRMEVRGLETLPPTGPLLLAANHDSYWDPITVGIAALPVRPVRALAKSELWRIRGLDRLLDGMGQIPVDRGNGDVGAMSRALEELRGGACIGLFPEGTRSRGTVLRARSGFGRLAEAVPEAQVALVAIRGTTDISRFPTRPRVELEFFRPAGGGLQPGEQPGELAVRLLAELRERVPPAAIGRRRD